MKKILIMFMSVFAVCNVSAQNVVETAVRNSNITDNVFIGLNGGGSWSLTNRHKAFWKNVNPMTTLRIGKWVTPAVGAQISFEGGFNEGNKTFIDHTNLTLDGLLNLSNLFGGYNGVPRVFEAVGVLGAGWFHTYGNVTNRASAKVAVELNFNLGSSKSWQINLIPSWTYVAPPNAIENSYAALSVGATYRFRNKSNTQHYFTLVPVLDMDEWNHINNEVNRLRDALDIANNHTTETIVKEVVETVEVGITKPNLNNVVGFALNSDEVSPTQMANLSSVAQTLKDNVNLKINVIGYADEDTGTFEYNQTLSERRAFAVKNVLVNVFGVNPEQIITQGNGSSIQPFIENSWNRAVLFMEVE